MNFAVIGAGGFARFAVAQFVKRSGVRLVGVYDTDSHATSELIAEYPGIKVYASMDDLLADPAISLVYIGSPPFLHFEQSLASLKAGKHVICEKPAATELSHAELLRDYAREHDLLFVVNLMQRYNPLYAAVQAVVDGKYLGEFIHGFFENYASHKSGAGSLWGALPAIAAVLGRI